jgi:putative oxidoreductase
MTSSLAVLFRTNRNVTDATLVLLRLAMGIIMFPHGAQKMLGWFGGYGFASTMHALTAMMHIPVLLAVLAILAEFVGSILLIAGALTRLAALAISVNMAVAAVLSGAVRDGFFSTEYFIYALAVGITLTVVGPGRYSVDALLAKEERPR